VVQVGSEADDSASGGRAAKLKGKKQSVRVKEAEPREKESAGEKLLRHLCSLHCSVFFLPLQRAGICAILYKGM
jgi:hypothetical protein